MKKNLLWFALSSILLCLFIYFLVKKLVVFNQEIVQRQIEKSLDLKEWRHSLLGYPAPESDIVSGRFYQCEAAMQEQWPDHTNHFLVLQEMKPNGQYWKMLRGQKRLFSVSKTVKSGGVIYQAERTNGTLNLKPMGMLPPFPLPKVQRSAPPLPKASLRRKSWAV